MAQIDLPYSECKEHGRAWSPSWDGAKGGFDCWLVLAPPGVEELQSIGDYRLLLARRIEYQLEEWMSLYADELPVNIEVDEDEDEIAYERAVRSATLSMIEQHLPNVGSLNPAQSNRQIAQAIANALNVPNINFPIQLPPIEDEDGFGDCLDDSTLKGWLLEVQ